MSSELLQHVRVIDPVAESDRVADVLIQDGCITQIAAAIADYPSETQVQNGHSLVLGPGLVDLYSHSGEPGFETRETLDSLQQAAIAGGFTRVAVLPDTVPALDNPAAVSWLHEKTGSGLHLWGALTIATQGQQMTGLIELAASPVVGFADGQPIALALVRRVLEYLRPVQRPIALWACDPTLSGGAMREGQDSIRLGLPGVPAIAETAALAALLECVEQIGTPVHLMRVSTARSVQLIQAAKARAVPVTASTTWLHLLLDTEAIGSYNPNLRLSPPLGTPADRIALVHAVRDGIVDAIAVDHTPYTYEEKTVAFAEAPSGAIGLELALPLLWHRFVETGEWSALELWRSLSLRPALCLNQTPPTIALGPAAELVLFDPQPRWTVEGRSLKSRSTNTSWLGQEIQGRVLKVWTPK